jgi:hypothetical protein
LSYLSLFPSISYFAIPQFKTSVECKAKVHSKKQFEPRLNSLVLVKLGFKICFEKEQTLTLSLHHEIIGAAR